MTSTPDFSKIKKQHKNYQSNYYSALQYAHEEFNSSDLKKEIVRYIKSIDSSHFLLDKINSINENRIAVFGKYTYILNNGGDLPEDIKTKLIPSLEKVILEELEKNKKNKKEEDTTVDVVPVNIQERILEKTRNIAAEIEGWIDELADNNFEKTKSIEDFTAFFRMHEMKAPHARYMKDFFNKRALEINEVTEGKNKELAEGYSNLSKKQLKNYNTFFINLIKSCELLEEISKNSRTPRKKKPISKEKQVIKLKYKKEDTTLGLVSINPTQIIGAKELWVYNCKTRKLTHYKSLDERGLLIRGTSIDNYSHESIEKMLRKPAESLSEFKKAGKIKLRTFLKDLSTVDVKAQGKINEHHIILRIDK